MIKTEQIVRPPASSRRIGRNFIPTDERIISDQRPSMWLILFQALPRIGVVAVCGLLFIALSHALSLISPYSMHFSPMLFVLTALLCTFLLISALLDWMLRRYLLTNRRAISVRGILHQTVTDVPLKQIQNIGLSRPLLSRLVGIGHIGIATAGSDGWDLTWTHVRNPHDLITRVRDTMCEVDA